jgi:hypothetical protein
LSKQPSKKAQLQRFSGPELSDLLELVAAEHGPTAAISAVNRVRSGGVAGFFCREEFEVIVDLRGSARRSAGSTKRPAEGSATPTSPARTVSGSPDGIDPVTPTIDLASATPIPQTSLIEPPSHPDRRSPSGEISPDAENDAVDIDLSDGLLPTPTGTGTGTGTDTDTDRDAEAGPEPTELEPTESAGSVFGGPRPEEMFGGQGGGTHAGFMALLQRRLDETAAEEPEVAPRRTPAEPPEPVGPPSVDVLAKPVMPAPAIDPLETPAQESFNLLESEPVEPSGFWRRIQEIDTELAGFLPVASAFVAVVGPLSLTTPVVRRLRTKPGLVSADVVALTTRAEIVSEPQWRLVRSGNKLIEEAENRDDRPTILVIDVPVEFPNWVPPLLSHLRMAGVGLFRYAVPGRPDTERLERYRLASDVPYVLDLVSRCSPDDLVDFIADRHPIASVSGAEMTAELLHALRRSVEAAGARPSGGGKLRPPIDLLGKQVGVGR